MMKKTGISTSTSTFKNVFFMYPSEMVVMHSTMGTLNVVTDSVIPPVEPPPEDSAAVTGGK
jgi:hypothetical protein